MIKYKAGFLLYRQVKPELNKPFEWYSGHNVWCSFDVGTQQIMCKITYDDEENYPRLLQYYKCLISLPYGEKFPPNSPATKEYPGSIDLGKEYNLNYGAEVFGKCILKEIVEIIPDYYGTID